MNGLKGFIIFATVSLVAFTDCKPTGQDEVTLAAPKPNTVCYTDIGCFSKNGTFGGILNMLPESPEAIGTSFTLFSKRNLNAGQAIHYSEPDTLTSTLFDSSLETVLLIHGFAVIEDPKEWFLKSAFLNHLDCQVIVVDWRKGAVPPTYWTGTANSELVGRQVAVLIKALVDQRGLKTERVHIVGSSLGAHVAGFAGKWLRDLHGLTLGRISGNDPAGPYFHDTGDSVHLSSKDALFVDIIHSNGGRDLLAGQAGMEKPIGHVDFYPNGGVYQPGCVIGHATCSHMRADALYAESLNSNDCIFKSYPCKGGYKIFEKGQCRECIEQGCSQLGFGANQKSGRGVQFLDTNAKTPFCKSE